MSFAQGSKTTANNGCQESDVTKDNTLYKRKEHNDLS